MLLMSSMRTGTTGEAGLLQDRQHHHRDEVSLWSMRSKIYHRAKLIGLLERMRSRSPIPPQLPLAEHIDGIPHGTPRGPRQVPRQPDPIFKDMFYHLYSPVPCRREFWALRQALDVSPRCHRPDHFTDRQREGARGRARIEDADVIIIVGGSQMRGQVIKATPPPRPTSGQMSLLEVYHHFAARKDRAADPQDSQRKCVVHAEWVDDCIREKRWLPYDRMNGWEIL
jgi:hypothetical protein